MCFGAKCSSAGTSINDEEFDFNHQEVTIFQKEIWFLFENLFKSFQLSKYVVSLNIDSH